ncbi:MAG: flippase-like domain-containing protein [Deltaproteobacteria bacterium]|nr:flippase-like domain-containing protein [Deltaproteobacteria bacterium]
MALLGVFFIWLLVYIRSHAVEFSHIFDLSIEILLLLFVVLLVDSIILGVFTKILLGHLGVALRFVEWYGLSIVSNLWNYILPFRGGAGIRAVYLKKVYQFKISDFLGTMMALYFVTFLVNSIIGLSCLLYLYYEKHYLNVPVFSFLLIVFAISSIVIGLSPRIHYSGNRFVEKLCEVLNAWHSIKRNHKLIMKLIIVILFHALFQLLGIYLGFRAYGLKIALYQCLLISSLLEFSALANLTPGSLGITEGIMVIGAQLFGVTPAQSLLSAGLIRVVNMCLIFSTGPLFQYFLTENIKGVPATLFSETRCTITRGEN